MVQLVENTNFISLLFEFGSWPLARCIIISSITIPSERLVLSISYSLLMALEPIMHRREAMLKLCSRTKMEGRRKWLYGMNCSSRLIHWTFSQRSVPLIKELQSLSSGTKPWWQQRMGQFSPFSPEVDCIICSMFSFSQVCQKMLCMQKKSRSEYCNAST